jgi:hypothetical protein
MNLFKSFDIGIGKKLWKATPAPPGAWIHQIHTAGGVGDSINIMVWCLLGLCAFCVIVFDS